MVYVDRSPRGDNPCLDGFSTGLITIGPTLDLLWPTLVVSVFLLVIPWHVTLAYLLMLPLRQS
jgi:hypothetical protein